ncbi:MAG: hypothetical protein AB1649_31920, partial [Chloroflexota bacterium]
MKPFRMRERETGALPRALLALLAAALLSNDGLAGCQPAPMQVVPTPTPLMAMPTSVIPTVTPTPLGPAQEKEDILAQLRKLAPTATPEPTATPTAWIAPSGFPTDVYPPPLPVAEGVVMSPLSAGCPNPAGLERADQLPLNAVLEVLT